MKQNTINKEYAYQVLNENYADYKRNGDPDDTTHDVCVEFASTSGYNPYREQYLLWDE